MNAETFGIPLRRGRGGFRGRGGMGFRGGRGRGFSRGSFGSYPGGSGFRGGFRGSQGGREFSDFEYRVMNEAKMILVRKINSLHKCTFKIYGAFH